MSNTIDNIIAFKILKTLVIPFKDTEAFKHGIIDAKGNVVKTNLIENDYDYYNNFHKIIFNLKKLLNKVPGGDKYTKNLVAAYMLLQEEVAANNTSVITDAPVVKKRKQKILRREG